MKHVFIDGKRVEIWENEQHSFGTTQAYIDMYALNERWELLFNALILDAAPFARCSHE